MIEKYDCGAVADDNPAAVATATASALNSNYLDQFGLNARRCAEEVLDWRVLTTDLERLYQQVLADP